MGDGYNAIWTNNKASLTVDATGTFDMADTPTIGTGPVVDALNGFGTITDGTGNNTLTIGAAGGSGTFGRTITQGTGRIVGLAKTGAGTQDLSGAKRLHRRDNRQRRHTQV